MNKRIRHFSFQWLLLMTLISLSVSAKTYKGTINIEVGETYYVTHGYNNSSAYTVSGYWTKTDGNAFVITASSSGNGGCEIKGNQVGTSTLNWWGVIYAGGSLWEDDYYWTVNVQPKSKKVTNIILNKTSSSLVVGGQEQLSATVLPTDATNPNINWNSSNNNVATVNNRGLVEAKNTGTTTITCSAVDGSGVKATCSVTVVSDYKLADINESNFPDENFRNYLLSQDYGSDGKLMASEATKASQIWVESKNITSLKGIEFFSSLKKLSCAKNKLTSLDLSSNTMLESLYCESNQLTELNLVNNVQLKWIRCHHNKLTSLNVSQCKEIMQLQCQYNQLTSLDVTQNTALSNFRCDDNQLVSLDLSRNTSLKELWCAGNNLTALDLSNNGTLEKLYCYSNQLTFLDVSPCTLLTNLSCGSNQLLRLDVTKNTALEDFSCYRNLLTELNLSNNTSLTKLSCSRNKLTGLDVSKNTQLTTIDCYSNQIRGAQMDKLINSLPTGSNSADRSFNLIDRMYEGNVCTKVQVAVAKSKGWIPKWYNTSMYWVEFEGSDNEGIEINATYFPDDNFRNCLQELEYYGIDGFFAPTEILSMTYLNVERKNIASLQGIEYLTSLKSLNCHGNLLSELNVSGNPLLTHLDCGRNKINGAAMDELISSLPQNSTDKLFEFYVFDNTQGDEENICTKSQVADARAKGWKSWQCKSYNENIQTWGEYWGSASAKPESISLPTEATVTAGQTITLTLEVTPANAEYTLTWSSDDETVATVSQNGVVTGVKKGRTFINVETDNGKTAYCKLTVTAPEPVSIELPKTATVYVGGTLTLTPTITPEGAETTLTWKSDDEAVVRVSTNGTLTGVAEGLALVTVSTSNGLTSNACKVTVGPDPSGISTVMMDEMAGVPVYSTSGQRLTAPRKGINIIGGKKVVIK